VPLLLCVALPIAMWWALTRRGAAQALGIALVVLFAGEIAFSGSRGAVIAAAGGTLVTALTCVRSGPARALAVGAVALGALVCIEAAKLPQANASVVAPASPGAVPVPTKAIDAQQVFRQEDEIGFPLRGAYTPAVPRTLFGSSGRGESWNGALQQGKQRPVAGYGFGTEEHVFVDRFFSFEGRLVENSYLGLFLQLGVVGVVLLVALLAVLFWSGVRALRARPRSAAAAATGVLLAAVLAGMTQSGLLSVGNIAAAAIWLCVLPLALLAER
jgi:O-Antigen ligase